MPEDYRNNIGLNHQEDSDFIKPSFNDDMMPFFNKQFQFQKRPPHGSYPPPHPPPPPFGHPLPLRHPPFGPPLPMTLESFKEIKHFIILMIISDKPKGITGYQLQEKYHFPRGTILKILNELETMGYLEYRETVIKGRAQKFYIISNRGKQYFEELKEKWANHFALMSDMAPPEKFSNPFFRKEPLKRMIRNINKCESKEDALDYFRGIRSNLKFHLTKIEKKRKNLEYSKNNLDEIIRKIEQMKEFDKATIKKMLQEKQKEFHKNSINRV